jgi:hypothetical protein
MTVSDGALDSSNNKYQGAFSQSGGTILSINDEMSSSATLSDLVATSTIRKLQSSSNLTISGDSKSAITLDGVQGQQATISDFATCQVQGCDLQTATISDCGLVNGAGSTFSTLNASNLDLGIFRDASMMIVSDSNIVDSGSTITATDCNLTVTGSTVIAMSSTIQANGGTITASDSCVITSQAATVTNPDGLTMGMGFSPEEQGGCLIYETGVLTLECFDGEVLITAPIVTVDDDI